MLEVFINNELIDYDGEFNIIGSLGDLQNIDSGNLMKTYSLNVPLTSKNKRILGHPGTADVRLDGYSSGRLEFDGVELLNGAVKVLARSDREIRLIITAQDWIDEFQGSKLKDISTLGNQTYDETEIIASWSGTKKTIRFPFVDRGALISGQSGLYANHYVQDFIPWIRIKNILDKVFYPISVDSDHFDGTEGDELIMTGIQVHKDDTWLENRDLEVSPNADSDNQTGSVISDGVEEQLVLIKDPVVFNNEVTDEAFGFNPATYKYTIPETGTWRFKMYANLDHSSLISGVTITQSSYTLRIRKNGTTIAEDTCSDGSGDTCVAPVTLYSRYYHFEEGDEVDCYLNYKVTFDNQSGGDYSASIFIDTTSKIELVWDARCKYPGEGIYDINDWLPDIDCLTFLKGLKYIYNLLFFYDQDNGKIYIEPADTFYTSNVRDITDRIVGGTIEIEDIGNQFKKNLRLKFKHDAKDQALEDYEAENGEQYGQHDIELTNPNVQEGLQILENPVFGTFVIGYSFHIAQYSIYIPKFYKEFNKSTESFPAEKLVDYIPRIGRWIGNSRSLAWKFEGLNKSTQPEVAPLDMQTMYGSYWQKSIYRINLGQLFKMEILMNADELTEFVSVKSDDQAEGFRTTYKAMIEGIELYFVLIRITHNGNRAMLELLQKI